MTEPTVRVTRYDVSAYPDPESINAHVYTITVEERSPGQWAVCWMSDCYDIDGEGCYETIPSERTDEWKARYRHDLDTALAIAKHVALTQQVNGRTAAQCWEWEQSQRATCARHPGGGA